MRRRRTRALSVRRKDRARCERSGPRVVCAGQRARRSLGDYASVTEANEYGRSASVPAMGRHSQTSRRFKDNMCSVNKAYPEGELYVSINLDQGQRRSHTKTTTRATHPLKREVVGKEPAGQLDSYGDGCHVRVANLTQIRMLHLRLTTDTVRSRVYYRGAR
eukprot:6199725-Pleurochrysis_carterae.AAC.1